MSSDRRGRNLLMVEVLVGVYNQRFLNKNYRRGGSTNSSRGGGRSGQEFFKGVRVLEKGSPWEFSY